MQNSIFYLLFRSKDIPKQRIFSNDEDHESDSRASSSREKHNTSSEFSKRDPYHRPPSVPALLPAVPSASRSYFVEAKTSMPPAPPSMGPSVLDKFGSFRRAGNIETNIPFGTQKPPEPHHRGRSHSRSRSRSRSPSRRRRSRSYSRSRSRSRSPSRRRRSRSYSRSRSRSGSPDPRDRRRWRGGTYYRPR